MGIHTDRGSDVILEIRGELVGEYEEESFSATGGRACQHASDALIYRQLDIPF